MRSKAQIEVSIVVAAILVSLSLHTLGRAQNAAAQETQKAVTATYNNGQFCNVSSGGNGATFPVPDGFSLASCQQVGKDLQWSGIAEARLGCASASGIKWDKKFVSGGVDPKSCGWR